MSRICAIRSRSSPSDDRRPADIPTWWSAGLGWMSRSASAVVLGLFYGDDWTSVNQEWLARLTSSEWADIFNHNVSGG